MGFSKGTIKREHSHLTENWEVPQYNIRLMRRLKRRYVASEMMEHNYNANAKRKKVGSCGDEVVKNAENRGHILEEEVDEDYEFFLDNVDLLVDVVNDNNIIAYDIDVNTSHESDNDDDIDAQYKISLENLREADKSYILKVFADNQLFGMKYEGQEERLHDLVNSEILHEDDDEDYQLFLNSSRIEGDKLVYMPESDITIEYGGSESEGKSSKVRQNLQVPFERAELPNSRQASDDYGAVNNKRHSEVLSDFVDEDWQIFLDSEFRKNSEDKRSAVRKNFKVFNEATESEPPKAREVSDVYHVAKHNNEVPRDIDDEDYQLFLNSSRVDGDHLICMPERAITMKDGVSESEERSSKVKQNLQVPHMATERPNSRQCSDDYHVAKNKLHNGVLSDVEDEDWQIFLNPETFEEKRSAARQNVQVFSEGTEPSKPRQVSDVYHVAKHNHENHCGIEDEDYQLFLNSSRLDGDRLICIPERAIRMKYGVSESEERSSKVKENLQVPHEATELPNSRQCSDDHLAAHKKHHGEVLGDVVDEDWQIFRESKVRKNSEEKRSAVRQNLQLQVSDEATELPKARQGLGASYVAKHKCNSKELCNIVDKSYQLFLKSVSTNGDNLIYMPENGVTVVYEEECDQSSTDSEPIILDPSQQAASCLADERNHKESLMSCASNPYREVLIEELKRPYNQKELDKLLQVASHERQKGLHRDMRYGVTKDRPKEGGDNTTSYLKMHRGLQKAINQVKEPHKVLFLLRGFFYWLEHLPQGGAFQPWLDASCLEMLQKL